MIDPNVHGYTIIYVEVYPPVSGISQYSPHCPEGRDFFVLLLSITVLFLFFRNEQTLPICKIRRNISFFGCLSYARRTDEDREWGLGIPGRDWGGRQTVKINKYIIK